MFDQEYCYACEADTRLDWVKPEPVPVQAIRELNDRFRRDGEGDGTLVVTSGLTGNGIDFVREAVAAVRSFDAFTPDNDPYGEHDFGAVEVNGQKKSSGRSIATTFP